MYNERLTREGQGREKGVLLNKRHRDMMGLGSGYGGMTVHTWAHSTGTNQITTKIIRIWGVSSGN